MTAQRKSKNLKRVPQNYSQLIEYSTDRLDKISQKLFSAVVNDFLAEKKKRPEASLNVDLLFQLSLKIEATVAKTAEKTDNTLRDIELYIQDIAAFMMGDEF